jgi:Phospholipase_D-nuclease N-terminal
MNILATISPVLLDPGRYMNLGDFLVAWIILGVIEVVLFFVALISIIASRRYTAGGKFIWFLVILAYPLLGALGWLIGGRNARIVRTP